MKGRVSGAWFVPISFSEKQEQMTLNLGSLSPQNLVPPNFKLSDSSYKLHFMILSGHFLVMNTEFLGCSYK